MGSYIKKKNASKIREGYNRKNVGVLSTNMGGGRGVGERADY